MSRGSTERTERTERTVRIDPDALGVRSSARTVTWDERDTMLYALAVGAGVDDLALTTDNTRDTPQRVLPSFAVVPVVSATLMRKVGEVPLASLMHASQGVRLARPLAPAGSLEVVHEVTDLVDKGEHAFVTITGTATDPETGALVVETRMGVFVRGGGGFTTADGATADGAEADGARARPRPAVPDGPVDHEVREATRADQALLYRLTGDRNPLHSDPAFAARAGFDRPILHGMATYGFATRALVTSLCGGDPDRVRSIDARLAAPVLPGAELVTRVRRTGAGTATFRTSTTDPDGGERIVLDDGVVEHVVEHD